ncbi:MAG: stage III sporulation protein AB [Clostridia bacterium]|nr:stage III sporulation protein AB [Clostridia bacterium]
MAEYIACVAVAAGFFFAGRYAAFRQNEKTAVIRDTVLFIAFCETKLRFASPPVADIMREAAGRSGRLSGFVNSCCLLLDGGVSFPQAWKASLDGERELCGLLGCAKAELESFGSDLGATDIQGQLSCCGYYKHFFETELEKRSPSSERSAKVFPALGAMLGALSVILFI